MASGAEELRPPEGGVRGWREGSAQAGGGGRWCRETAAALGGGWTGTSCESSFPRASDEPLPPCPRVRGTHLTHQMGRHRLWAPPLREGVHKTQGEHDRNHRLRGIIAKDQEDVQSSSTTKLLKKQTNKKRTKQKNRTKQKTFQRHPGRVNTSCRCRKLPRL